MAALGKKLRTLEGSLLAFWCPGCKISHAVRVGHTTRPNWEFNGNAERPTFAPSVLVRSGHYVPGYEKEECWCTYNAAHPEEPVSFGCGICHTFVTDGKIQFLGDCTHALVGQTVDLPDFPGNE